MEFSQFADLPVVDCHVHFVEFGAGKVQVTAESLSRHADFLIKVAGKGRVKQISATGRDAGLYLKARHPGVFYAGGFVPWSGETSSLRVSDWRRYIESLIDLGFDGIGEMGNKPVLRRLHEPLDGDYYRGFWEACEEMGMPVLCHVADPEEFWDEKAAPEWAKSRGWVYYMDDYPTKEELCREMENVLEAHPDLRVVLCHFYFISADIEGAERFLNRYENVSFDLALGIELIRNISRRRDDWREFFIKFDDRILFGTDIATWQTIREALDRIWLIRNFLESDEEFYTPKTADMLLTRYEAPFLGLKLPRGTLKKIYSENFKKIWGDEPRQLNIEEVIKAMIEKGEEEIAKALEPLRQPAD